MNHAELREYIQGVFNRDDATEALIEKFISMALRRTDRLLRTALQRVSVEVTVDDDWVGGFPIPSDFIGLYRVTVNGTELYRIVGNQSAIMNGFDIKDAKFVFTPDLQAGDELLIEYYNEFAVPANVNDPTTYSVVIPDVITYGTLFFAGSYFQHVDTNEWNSIYIGLIGEVQEMADREDFVVGGAISPMGGGII